MGTIYKDSLSTLIDSDFLSEMKNMKDNSVDLIITDPPYFLSNNGISNSGGKMISVNKGAWDKNTDTKKFYNNFIKQSWRILKDNGTMWVFGNMHNVYLLGYLIQNYGFKILNNVTWQKSNPAPNLSRRMFTHSTETILWVKKPKGKQVFNYQLMREINNNKQMKDVWTTPTINKSEKRFGKHPTQKPLSILLRIIEASSDKNSLILDPFIGSGTTTVAAKILGRQAIGIDNNLDYLKIAEKRLSDYQNEKVGNIK